MIGKSPRTRNVRPIRQSLPVTFNGWRIVPVRSHFVGFHSRASCCRTYRTHVKLISFPPAERPAAVENRWPTGSEFGLDPFVWPSPAAFATEAQWEGS